MTTDRVFWSVDPQKETILMEFYSKSPRDAALKAATRGQTLICLVDPAPGKLHMFRGERIPITDKETTAFTQARNITTKPTVSKMNYRNTGRSLKRNDMGDICAQMRVMME